MELNVSFTVGPFYPRGSPIVVLDEWEDKNPVCAAFLYIDSHLHIRSCEIGRVQIEKSLNKLRDKLTHT